MRRRTHLRANGGLQALCLASAWAMRKALEALLLYGAHAGVLIISRITTHICIHTFAHLFTYTFLQYIQNLCLFVCFCIPGSPKGPKIMAQYSKTETISTIGSIILGILQIQVLIFVLIY